MGLGSVWHWLLVLLVLVLLFGVGKISGLMGDLAKGISGPEQLQELLRSISEPHRSREAPEDKAAGSGEAEAAVGDAAEEPGKAGTGN